MSLSLLLGPQLRALSNAGFEVVCCSAPGPYVHELHSWGLEHHPLRHLTRASNPSSDLRAFAEIVSLFRSLRVEAVDRVDNDGNSSDAGSDAAQHPWLRVVSVNNVGTQRTEK